MKIDFIFIPVDRNIWTYFESFWNGRLFIYVNSESIYNNYFNEQCLRPFSN